MSQLYSLRQRAREDLESIWLYTLNHWDVEQADQYIRMVVDRFEWLTENPKAGKLRKDIQPGCYSIPIGSHLIFYQLIDHRPDILRILHQRADVAHWLP
ncbi:type II toxin-antitoxin system RelE/ParE family toxin [Endozoicomonas sp. SCSIO W0465]|uniref:type II toxin-antitoxin system RelE/ParE family toxin n=1 Tax=Endozoicomonas sp. SCSIO W0465 TaxID=2918516 RepID=UPI0020764741|nr:type II toxin-antitoxin system RelE/ParE family toxin [Endozoicomonas sp. SCSIO W0465]USE35870.1 type II toxin-antitoxin system RelE/ParE family toxin [Endozoicomonas sp. SCSIO W0465]